MAIATAALLVVLAVAIAWWWTRDDADEPAAGTPTAPASVTPTTPPSPAPTLPPTSEPAATTDTTPPPASTTASTTPDPGRVDVGAGVGFTLPAGFTAAAVAPGVEVSDGTVRLFAAASVRTAGEDPIVVLQEYVTGFDALYASAAYGQVAMRPPDPSGAPVDGRSMRYRVLAADGTGYTGRIDVLRRADGLVLLTDRYVAIDAVTATPFAPADASLVPAAFAELAASLVAAPAVGSAAPLTPLAPARVSSVHPQLGVDGAFALMPPTGWVDVGSVPGRVVVAHPAGETFVVERTADTADPAVAELQALAALLTQWPTATAGPFAALDPADGRTARTVEAAFTATAPDGRAVQGTVRSWWGGATGRSWVAVVTSLVDVTPQPGHAALLLAQTDAELAGLPA